MSGAYAADNNTHTTQVSYIPFFGFDADNAYSPFVYVRSWYGRTTKGYVFNTAQADADNDDTSSATTESFVQEGDPPAAHDTQGSRRLRASSKLLKAAKLQAVKPSQAVHHRMQSTFHFRMAHH